jgi:hypothetical protein
MDVVGGRLRQNAVLVSVAAKTKEEKKCTEDFSISCVRMDSMYYGERKFPFGKVIRKPFF